MRRRGNETSFEALEPRWCLAVTPTVIDLLALYTPGAYLSRGGDDPVTQQPLIHNVIREAINTANLAFQNSLIPVVLRLVHMTEANYGGTGDLGFDLDRLSNPNDGFVDEAHTLRNQYGADLVTLISDDDPYTGGIADLLSNLADPNNPKYAFSVIGETQLEAGQTTFAHEIGHNLGGGHERNNPTEPAVGPFPYSYGHRFNVGANSFHDIMSYDPGVEVPYFANPNVLFRGIATGVAEGAANAADIAKTFLNTMSLVSGYRPTVVADTVAPTASLYDASLAGNVLTFSVRYRDNSALDVVSITTGQLRVGLADGAVLRPTLMSVDGADHAFQRLATYRVVLPAGRTAIDSIQFNILGGQIGDVQGNMMAAQALTGGEASADSAPFYLTGARNLGTLATSSQRFISESVGLNDEDDVYSFTLAGPSTVAVTLSGLTNTVDAFFVNDINANGEYDGPSEQIDFTFVSSPTGDRSLSATLNAGTYFIWVHVDPSDPTATPYELSIRSYTDATPPTVAFLDAPDITSEVPEHIIAVTYSDNQELDGYGTVGFGGLVLHADFDGGGFFETVIYPDESLNPDESNAAVRTLYYRIPALDDVAFTSFDNGLYTLSIYVPGNVNQPRARDAAFNAVPASTTVGSFRVAIGNTPADTTAPKARLHALAPTVAGTNYYDFTVTYADNRALNIGSLSTGRVRVFGPQGYDQLATVLSVSGASPGGNARTVTYRMAAPGGVWDAGDDGLYSLSLPSNQVFDATGNHTGMLLGQLNSQIDHLTINGKGAFFFATAGPDTITIDGDASFAYFQLNDTILQHAARADIERISLTAAGEDNVLLRSGAFTGAFHAGVLTVQSSQLVLDGNMILGLLAMPAADGMIDLKTFSITVTSPTPNTFSQVQQWIAGGRLISSSITSGFRLAAVKRSDGSIVIKRGRFGDTNLDGRIDADDYKRTDKGYLTGGDTWQAGDFDGNGSVNIDDYALLDASFLEGQSGGAEAAPGAESGESSSPTGVFQSTSLIADARAKDEPSLWSESDEILA